MMATRYAVALLAYIGGLVLVTIGFFEAAAMPGLAFWFGALLVVSLGLVTGLWWILPLALVVALPAARIGNAEADIVVVPALVIGTVLVLAACIPAHRHVSRRWASRVGVSALVLASLLAAWAAYRQVAPLDDKPAHPVLVNVPVGKAGSIWLGDPLESARRGLGELDESDSERPSSGNLGYATFGDVTLWYAEDGSVMIIDAHDARFQTTEGVGVGDSLAHARRVYPGLLCNHDSFGDEECAGRDGNRILILTGNPIYSLVLSSLRCYPEISGYADPESGDCPQAQHLLRG